MPLPFMLLPLPMAPKSPKLGAMYTGGGDDVDEGAPKPLNPLFMPAESPLTSPLLLLVPLLLVPKPPLSLKPLLLLAAPSPSPPKEELLFVDEPTELKPLLIVPKLPLSPKPLLLVAEPIPKPPNEEPLLVDGAAEVEPGNMPLPPLLLPPNPPLFMLFQLSTPPPLMLLPPQLASS